MGHLRGGQELRGPPLPPSPESGWRQPEASLRGPSADTQGWEEIAYFISAESSRVYSHPGQQGGWCPFLEGVQ